MTTCIFGTLIRGHQVYALDVVAQCVTDAENNKDGTSTVVVENAVCIFRITAGTYAKVINGKIMGFVTTEITCPIRG